MAATVLEIDLTQETLEITADSRDASAIQGRSIETGTPTDGEVLTYSSSGSEWIYQTITENVDDRVAALIQDSAGGGLTWTYDDSAGTLTPAYVGDSTLVTTGALNSGSITSGFTSIDVGAGAISTTGTVSGGVLAGTLSTASQTNITGVGTIGTGLWQGSVVQATYGGSGLVGATDGTIAIADGAGAPTTLDVGSSTAITIVGALDAGGSITSGFGDINNGASDITTTGTVSGGVLAGTLSTAAQGNVTSLGTLTALQVDNLNLNGNTISAAGGLNITPSADSQIVLDGAIYIDAGVVTGATSITSTAFVGDLTGDVTGNADTATLATTSTVTATSSNTDFFPVFVDSQSTGSQAIKVDGGLSYNPSTNALTASTFLGNVTGNLTGTVLTATQASITSAANLVTVGTIGTGVWQGTAVADGYVANDLTISGGTVNNSVIGGSTAAAITGTTLKADTSLELATGETVTGIDNSSLGTSATLLATAGAIRTYVDAQVTAQDLDIISDSGNIDIDLDGDSLTLTGGTGIDTSASGEAVTFAIDSTVVTKAGTQTLTNKTLTTPVISSISNTGTVTLPTSTDTLVGKATTDTLTNKSISGSTNTLSAIANGSLTNSTVAYGGVTLSLGGADTTPAFNLSDATAYTGDSSLVTVGALASGSIASGFTSISTSYTDAKVTSVVAGTLIDVSGTTGDVTVNTDLSELATSTSDGDGDFFAVVDAANAQKKLTKANISIAGFNTAVATSITGTGVLNGGSITSGFGAINNGASDITTTGTVSATTLTGTLSTASQTNISTLGTITSGTWNAGAVTSSGDIVSGGNIKVPGGAARYIIQDTNATNTYSLALQAGEGSAGYGGGLVLYGHSHASKPGWVTAGISASSDGKFTVNTQGLAGGTDVFVVQDDGNVGIGVTGPTSLYEKVLHIHEAAGSSSIHLTNNTTGSTSGDGTDIIAYQDDLYLWNRESAGLIVLGTNATDAMTVSASQDVNIPNGGLAIGTTSSPVAGAYIKQTTDDFYGIVIEEDASDGWIRMGHDGDEARIHTTYSAVHSTPVPLILGTGNHMDDQLYLATDGNVGIGVTAVGTALLDPSSKMTVKGDVWSLTHSDGGFKVNNHTAGTTGGALTFFKSRQGNYDPPSAAADDVVNGDTLFSVIGMGYSGSQFNESARMLAQVDGTFTSNQKPPGRFVFQTGISNGAMAEAMRIDSSQDVTFAGSLFIGGNDTEFDDYEEGAWTPAIEGVTSGAKVAGTGNIGRYTKVGNLCTVSGTVVWSSGTTIVGLPMITGLPFATRAQSGGRDAGSFGSATGMTFPASGSHSLGYQITTDQSRSNMYLIAYGESSYGNPVFAATGAIYGFTMTYQTD